MHKEIKEDIINLLSVNKEFAKTGLLAYLYSFYLTKIFAIDILTLYIRINNYMIYEKLT